MDTMGARRPRRHHAKRLGYLHRLQASKIAGEDLPRLHRSDISQALADLGEASTSQPRTWKFCSSAPSTTPPFALAHRWRARAPSETSGMAWSHRTDGPIGLTAEAPRVDGTLSSCGALRTKGRNKKQKAMSEACLTGFQIIRESENVLSPRRRLTSK